MADRIVAVVGDTVDLIFETNEAVLPDVEVDYQSVPVKTNPNQTTPPANINFSEKLTAVPAPLPDSPKRACSLFASSGKSTSSSKDPVLESRRPSWWPCLRGTSTETGRLVTASIRELLFVQAIDVTTDAKLTRIMPHEFVKADGAGGFVFYSKPAEDFVGALSVQQKKLL